MNIHIIFRGPFPYGGVGANRIISYAKELAKNHHTVVHCIQPTKNYPGCHNNRIIGRYQGVLYFYSSGLPVWPSLNTSYIAKIAFCIIGYFFSLKYIFRYRRNAVVYLYTRSFFDILIYFLASRFSGTKLIMERSELPYHLNNNDTILRKLIIYVYLNAFISLLYKLFDGLIVETESLLDFYKKYVRHNAKLYILPNTIDFSRFENVKITYQDITNVKYIAYAGNMSKYDGIDLLIEAFNLLKDKYPDLHLFLIGRCNEELFRYYQEKVKSYNLDLRVRFVGQIPNTDVPQFLISSIALVLASPVSIRNTVSLPYKLGEYLASQRPVIVTGVGTIPEFLTDGLNSFIAEPGNVLSLYEKLNTCLSLPDVQRIKIGAEGKKIAYQLFDSIKYSNGLLQFIESLIN